MMMDAVENLVETLGYVVQVLERQLAVVQLAVRKYLVYKILHQPLYAGRGRVG